MRPSLLKVGRRMPTSRLMEDGSTRLGEDERERLVAALLAEYPEAPVIAVDRDGLFAPVPEAICGEERRVHGVRAPLELVVAEDLVELVGAWSEARLSGVAVARGRTVAAPGTWIDIHIVDLDERYGVSICIPVGLPPGIELQRRDHRHAEVVLAPRVATLRRTREGAYLAADESMTAMFGWTLDDLNAFRGFELVHPQDRDLAVACWYDMLTDPGPSRRARLRYKTKWDTFVWVDLTGRTVTDVDGNGDIIYELLDVSDEVAAQDAVRNREQRLNRLTEALPVGVFEIDPERRLTFTNDQLHLILGMEPRATADEQFSCVVDDDRSRLLDAFSLVLLEASDLDVEVCFRPPYRKELRTCRVTLRSLTDSDHKVTGAIACVEDVTEAARLKSELEERASVDALTGCHSRSSVLDTLQQVLRSPDLNGVAVIFADLDKFKLINDSMGHAAGDELLTIVAERLGGAVRSGDIVGRLGGDEFLVVCPNTASPDEAMAVAVRIGGLLRREASLSTGSISPRASIGVAWAPDGSVSPDALVASADAAMYEAKAIGDGLPVLHGADERRNSA